MALINDPRLYSGGSAEFNTRPHIALYANLKAREQARTDAFDEYIRNLNKNINPAGLRNQERAVFEDKLKKWQEMGIHNKELLRNPRKDEGQASMQFQSGYQDLLNLIAESKGEEEKKKPFVEIYTDPAKRDRINEEEVMPKIQAHDQPIHVKDPITGQWYRDEKRRSLGIQDINFDPKPFELNTYLGGFKDIKKTDLPPTMVKDSKNMTQTVTTTSVYDDEGKNSVATRATSAYMNDKSFKKTVDSLNPDEYKDFYKQEFGEEMQTPADLAAAFTLKALQRKEVKSELKDDIFARQKAMEGIRQANRKGLLRLKDELDDEDDATNDLWYDSYIDEITKEATSKQSKLYPGAGLGWEIPVDAFINKGLSKDGKSPDKLVYTTDGKYIPIFYQRNNEGNIEYRKEGDDSFPVTNTTYTVPNNRTQFKVSIGGKGGVKQLNKEMSSGKQSETKRPLPSGKPKTVQQNGYTYTWDENTGTYQ